MNGENDQAQLRAFPNPYRNGFSLIYQLKKRQEVEVQLLDLSGKLKEQLLTSRIQDPGEHTLQWSDRGLPAAIYILRIRTGDEWSTMRIAKGK
nr:T9SS type A sorting domain-containing protein [Flavilitoribacter nigricans]